MTVENHYAVECLIHQVNMQPISHIISDNVLFLIFSLDTRRNGGEGREIKKW